MRDIQPIIEKIRKTVASHRLGKEGYYARWLWQNKSGSRELGVNEYGCADAANILYSIGDFNADAGFRQGFISSLQSLQDEASGQYFEKTHNTIHTTAHCTAALELFDAKPKYPFKGFEKYETTEGLYSLLESLNWITSPWSESHKGAGIFAAETLAGNVGRNWENAYFEWLRREADPETGFWRRDYTRADGARPLYEHMAGSFHYLFNHEYASMPLRYPEKMLDSLIAIYREDGGLPASFGKVCGFLEIDWIFCMTRAGRQTTHRDAERRALLESFAVKYFDWLDSVDCDSDEGFNDLHMLFGTVCAITELYRSLPGFCSAEKPLKLVLDRRPFI